MSLRPAETQTVECADLALYSLRNALYFATQAGSPKTAARIRAAIASADAARRHAVRRDAARQVAAL